MAATLTRDLGLEQWYRQAPVNPYEYSLKWDGEWQVTYETFRDMGIAYGVGLILIYLLVVAQFRSYLVPLVIMAPIPLTLIGILPGHALLGAQFTATSMIGMIALAGIIVRNSILLVDFIHQQVRAGSTLEEAVIDSAVVRAKPIVLTGAGRHGRRRLHPRRPDLLGAGGLAAVRAVRLHRADAGGHPGGLLRRDEQAGGVDSDGDGVR